MTEGDLERKTQSELERQTGRQTDRRRPTDSRTDREPRQTGRDLEQERDGEGH